MKTDTFKSNGHYIERRESREGPSPYFVVCYRSIARITSNPKALKSLLKLGRGTETLQQLNAWLETFSPKTVALEIQQQQPTEHVANVA